MIPELPSPIANAVDHFTGRTWLLEPLLKWLNETDERLFILQGGPGTGKSTLLAWLAGAGPLPKDSVANKQLKNFREQVRAVHFCVAGSGSTAPSAFANNMVEQLNRNVPEFGEALRDTTLPNQIVVEQDVEKVYEGGKVIGVQIKQLNLAGLELGEELSFNRFFREPLRKLYEKGYSQPIIILVDALDEAQIYSGNSKLSYLLSTVNDLPQQVRFVVTTRPDLRILKYYDVKPFDLVDDAPTDIDDIWLYAFKRLSDLNGPQRILLAHQISQKATGTFLYAYLVLEDLLARQVDLSDIDQIGLPEGLADFYRQWFNRELGKDEERWFELFEPLFGVLAIVQAEGFTLNQLQDIVGKPKSQLLKTIRICQQYLSGNYPHGPFRLFHQSLVDFLLDEEQNIDYVVEAVKMHELIVRGYQKRYQGRWVKLDYYGINYLLYHLNEAETDNKLTVFHDGYAVQNLFFHVVEAGCAAKIEDVVNLVCEP